MMKFRSESWHKLDGRDKEYKKKKRNIVELHCRNIVPSHGAKNQQNFSHIQLWTPMPKPSFPVLESTDKRYLLCFIHSFIIIWFEQQW